MINWGKSSPVYCTLMCSNEGNISKEYTQSSVNFTSELAQRVTETHTRVNFTHTTVNFFTNTTVNFN